MVSTFWTNTIWYVLLGIITLFELIYTFFKAEKRSQVFAFFITILGVFLWIETPLVIFFKAYTYYPKILTQVPNPFDDVLAGNLFSQFSIAAAALLMVVRKLKYYWYLIFAVLYSLIEELFLALGIYKHYWYQTWMTFVFFPLLFWLVKIMYEKITSGIKPLFYYVYIFTGFFPLYIITLNWGLMLIGIQDMSPSVLSDPIMSRHILVVLQYIIFAIPLMVMYFSKAHLRWKALVVIALYILYYIAFKFNLILIKDGWFWPVSTANIFWMYFSVVLHDKLYGNVKILNP